MEQITLDLIKKFSNNYNQNSLNKIIENSIVNNGIEKTCIDYSIIAENQPIFNIELPVSKRYNQKKSYKCWIFSGLNFIQFNLAENLNIDLKNLSISNSYISFFDKLEKSNTIYENIIHLKDNSFEFINKDGVLDFCIFEGGYWQWFVSIVNKYGLLPYEYMPDAVESLNQKTITNLFSEKVKKNCIKLIKLKEENKTLEELEIMKEKFLDENYTFLSKILGEPKFNFNYEYKDKDGKLVSYKNLTPLEFKNKFLTIDLNNFISLGNIPMYNKQYYKLYRKKYACNTYNNSYAEFLNLPIKEIKELVIKQLKDNLPISVRVNLTKFKDKKSGVLDTRLFNYNKTFNLESLTKEEALNTKDIFPHHWLSICGANILDNGTVQRWKLEDSYGNDAKVDGYYIMNDNYFDEFILEAIINKKYLSNKQKEMLKQEPILFDPKDSF